jgi:hypothetical protein
MKKQLTHSLMLAAAGGVVPASMTLSDLPKPMMLALLALELAGSHSAAADL